MILILIAALTAAQPPQPPAQTFCTRMAAQLSMAPARRAKTFELSLFTAEERMITGGRSKFQVAITADADKAPALVKACGEDRAGFLHCEIGGPATYDMQFKGKSVPVEAVATDKATVDFTGTTLRCTDR